MFPKTLFSNSMMTLVGALALAVSVLTFSPSTAEAEYVVLASTVDSPKAGDVINDGEEVVLPPLGVIKLINALGRTVTLSGPYKGVPEASGGGGDGKFALAMSSLIRTSAVDTGSVGAIRAAGIREQRQALMVNISETGDYCVMGGTDLTLTRYKSETAGNVTITAVADGAKAEVPWPSGHADLPWPGTLKASDGAVYLVDQEGKNSRIMLIMHDLPTKPENDALLALELAERNCLEQARMVLALLRNTQ